MRLPSYSILVCEDGLLAVAVWELLQAIFAGRWRFVVFVDLGQLLDICCVDGWNQ